MEASERPATGGPAKGHADPPPDLKAHLTESAPPSIPRDSALRKGIAAGVVAAIIVIVVVQPLINRLLAAVAYIGATTLSSFSKTIYTNAALGEANTAAFDLLSAFSFLYAAVTGVGILLLFKLHVWVTRLERGTTTKKPLPPKRMRLRLSALIVLYLVGLTLMLASVSGEFARMQLNTCFRQRLTVVAPFVSEGEEKELRAMWASMKNRGDYERINTKLEEIARSHQIALPELLLGAR